MERRRVRRGIRREAELVLYSRNPAGVAGLPGGSGSGRQGGAGGGQCVVSECGRTVARIRCCLKLGVSLFPVHGVANAIVPSFKISGD